jgi:hypothetical protein
MAALTGTRCEPHGPDTDFSTLVLFALGASMMASALLLRARSVVRAGLATAAAPRHGTHDTAPSTSAPTTDSPGPC